MCEMKEKGLFISDEFYEKFLYLISISPVGKSQLVCDLLEEITQVGLTLREAHFSLVISTLARDENIAKALKVLYYIHIFNFMKIIIQLLDFIFHQYFVARN